jgi:hypothetical protein
MMADDPFPKGPYTLWQDYGYDGWAYDDFPTLEAALKAERHGSRWVIQRAVRMTVTDVTDAE